MSLNESVLSIFREINQIPRCSGDDQRLSDWLVELGKRHNWETIQDKAFNVLLKVPAKNLTTSHPVILQGHIDMVGVKEPDSQHDFTKDPIEMYEEDGWLKAKGTTLGADNGIAIAIALAIALDKTTTHPPLELLFTADEERGLNGANALQSNILTGKYLLNIDSEDEGIFTIGCAGGRTTHIELPLKLEKKHQNIQQYEINISKLSGGHSGIQIVEQKPNAIQFVARILNKLLQMTENIYLVSINGGVAHNAIPSGATARFACSDETAIENICRDMFTLFEKEYRGTEPDMLLSIERTTPATAYFDKESTAKVAHILNALPHGVFRMNTQMEHLVETSNNLAQVSTENEKLHILLSQRSSIASQLDFITQKIEAIAKLTGADVFSGTGYPAWEPDWESELLQKSILSYKNAFDIEPKIEVIHAGLECGIIKSKYPDVQMISFGPTIIAPHTPKERLKIADIEKITKFMLELFKNLSIKENRQ